MAPLLAYGRSRQICASFLTLGTIFVNESQILHLVQWRPSSFCISMCKHSPRMHSVALCTHPHMHKKKPSIFTAPIHRIHPRNTPYFLPPSLCSISPPLIALPVSLPSNSLPFMPSTSYHSDLIVISALFSLWSPVPLRLLPAVFVHCSPCTEMRWL